MTRASLGSQGAKVADLGKDGSTGKVDKTGPGLIGLGLREGGGGVDVGDDACG